MGNSLNELQDLKLEIEKKLERDSQNETYQKELDEINGKIENNQIFRRYFNGKIEKSEVCPSCQKEMYSHSKNEAFQCMREYVKN
tara:strand:+ start:402 stop:656 length:255 start_codon:yes stop_codon:yes gene_type:complete